MLGKLAVSELFRLSARWVVDTMCCDGLVRIASNLLVAMRGEVVEDGWLHLLVCANVCSALDALISLFLFRRVILCECHNLLKLFIDCLLC